jgi:hypothetical protein
MELLANSAGHDRRLSRNGQNPPIRDTSVCCRFEMSFHAASDEGIFAEDVLEARKQREEESRQVDCHKI